MIDGGPFPIYLHELAAFKKSKQGHQSNQKVWRILKSHGEITEQPFKEDAAIKLIAKLSKSVNDWIDTIDTSSKQVIIINDRDAIKCGLEQTSVRKQLREILKKKGESQSRVLSRNLSRAEINKHKLVIWQTRVPLFKGDDVYSFLESKDLLGKTIPIINYNCLRDGGFPLRFDVSFETSIEMFVNAIRESRSSDSALTHLRKFPHVLIRFDHGILHAWFEKDELQGVDIHGFNSIDHHLDPTEDGMMIGTTPLLVGSLLSELVALIEAKENEDPFKEFLKPSNHPVIAHPTPIDRAIDKGLILSSMHYTNGYGEYDPNSRPSNFFIDGSPGAIVKSNSSKSYGALCESFRELLAGKSNDCFLRFKSNQFERDFPNAVLARLGVTREGKLLNALPDSKTSPDALMDRFSRTELFSEIDIRIIPGDNPRRHSVEDKKELVNKNLYAIVRNGLMDTVRFRPEIEGDNNTHFIHPPFFCPFVKMGGLISVDRHDIDTLLSLRAQVLGYTQSSTNNRPLAIAVFGSPGSVKGFLVNEALVGISKSIARKPLEFNMSQWRDSDDLSRAFHTIQDASLESEVPVAFFDEFDCAYNNEELFWLKFFLMPIQDGRYIDSRNIYHLRKCIFVFAGGTASKYAEFDKLNSHKMEKKVPDFLSRLRAHIDIEGVNYTSGQSIEMNVRVKRAILLRGLLKKNAPQIFDAGSDCAGIDEDVIRMFLNVAEFRHGVRSMEAIIQMSKILPSSRRFHASALPTKSQLSLHVDADNFFNKGS
jgi:hypothetical protein